MISIIIISTKTIITLITFAIQIKEMIYLKCDDDIGYLLNKAARLSKLKVNQKLAEINLTFPQFLVIKHLHQDKIGTGDLSMRSPASIAEHLGYDRPTMTGIIDRLVRQGFVLRESNPSDRRSQTITLTEKAENLINVMDDFFEEVNAKTLDSFDHKAVENLKKYLHTIISNLDDKDQCIIKEAKNEQYK